MATIEPFAITVLWNPIFLFLGLSPLGGCGVIAHGRGAKALQEAKGAS